MPKIITLLIYFSFQIKIITLSAPKIITLPEPCFVGYVLPYSAPTPFRRYFTDASLETSTTLSVLLHPEGILPALPSKRPTLVRSHTIPKVFTDTFSKLVPLFRSCTFPEAFHRHFRPNAHPSSAPASPRRHFTDTFFHPPEGNARCTGHLQTRVPRPW